MNPAPGDDGTHPAGPAAPGPEPGRTPPRARADAGASGRAGLFARLRRLLGTTLEVVQLRVELLATDVRLGTLRLFDAIVLAAAALLTLAVGLGLLAAWIVLMLQPEYRLLAIGVLAVACLGGGVLALVVARNRLRQSGEAFVATRAELARDLAALGPDRPIGP